MGKNPIPHSCEQEFPPILFASLVRSTLLLLFLEGCIHVPLVQQLVLFHEDS